MVVDGAGWHRASERWRVPVQRPESQAGTVKAGPAVVMSNNRGAAPLRYGFPRKVVVMQLERCFLLLLVAVRTKRALGGCANASPRLAELIGGDGPWACLFSGDPVKISAPHSESQLSEKTSDGMHTQEVLLCGEVERRCRWSRNTRQ